MSDDFIDKTLVAPIRLDDAHGAWEYHPMADITPYELALITELFTAMVVRQTRLDWREFLTRDRTPLPHSVNPARHFKDV